MVVIKNAGNIRIKIESKASDLINMKELFWLEKMVKMRKYKNENWIKNGKNG